MKSLIAVVATLVTLTGICGRGNAVSAKPAMSTAEAIAAYEGTAEAAREDSASER